MKGRACPVSANVFFLKLLTPASEFHGEESLTIFQVFNFLIKLLKMLDSDSHLKIFQELLFGLFLFGALLTINQRTQFF